MVSRPDLRNVLVHFSWSPPKVSRWVQGDAALERSCLRANKIRRGGSKAWRRPRDGSRETASEEEVRLLSRYFEVGTGK